ncbi:MAG: purine-nucleoside phosphorylase [Mogibacterium sp.]|nr:purine-nucleoside phosphorylase [Mogibacterium sp.]
MTSAPVDLFRIVADIRERTDFAPRFGVVLGSGLGGLAQEVEVVTRISYADLTGFPRSTVEGHAGEYIFGYINGVPVVLMNGRVHYYEGYSMEQVVAPVRVMALLGVEAIILTNASGGLNVNYHPGTIMCIADMITTFIPSPLIGPNDDRLGVRFPEMSTVYDKEYRKMLHKTAEEEGIELEDGVYLQITGPAFETPVESRMYVALGADAVGMSTACETLVLRHMGVRVLGISCITDMAINNEDTNTTHEDIQKVAQENSAKLVRLVRGTLIRMAE